MGTNLTKLSKPRITELHIVSTKIKLNSTCLIEEVIRFDYW